MSGLLLAAGIATILAAALAIVFLVLAPPRPRVPIERRRAPGTPQVSMLTRATDRTVQLIDDGLKSRPSGTFSADELELAGVRMKPSAFVLMTACAAMVLAALGVLFGGLSLLSLFLAPLLAATAPIGAAVLLKVRKSRRCAKFADQLDDTLSLLAGGLRAGHSLLRAVDAVSQEMDAPTSHELARVLNETRIGRDLNDAFDSTATRMRSEDFRWVAQAIAINREVGGNLSDVFDQVGATIRERNQIRRQVKALSAEGRLSALVLILLPVAVFFFLLVTQPGYISSMVSSIFGILALVVGVILLVVGGLWLMASVRVKF